MAAVLPSLLSSCEYNTALIEYHMQAHTRATRDLVTASQGAAGVQLRTVPAEVSLRI